MLMLMVMVFVGIFMAHNFKLINIIHASFNIALEKDTLHVTY